MTKQVASRVLDECLKQTRSKTEPRTRTRTRSLVQVSCGVSGSTSIDLTVGLDSPPEAWMETDDLDALDDDRRHGKCRECYPSPWPLFKPFATICGKTSIYRNRLTDPTDAWKRQACPDCMARAVGGNCPACGAVYI